MPLVNSKKWESWVKNNQDPYGKACVDVARNVMNILDKEGGDFDPYNLICRADNVGGITGFMSGCVASMVSECHSRGEEFRRKWNHRYDPKSDPKSKGVINPAIINIG